VAQVTTIIAIQNEDGVVFGADSLVTANRKFNHPRMVKISQRGEFIIAGAGESAACDLAQHCFVPPKPTATDKKDIYHFIISKVIPSLKQCFKDNDYKWDKDPDDDYNFAFLIAVCGEVFDIADDFAVSLDSSGFYGVGSGSSLAIGALEAGADIQQALEIASKHDPYTGGPYMFMEQFKA
jgi:ATP-dependent protease HslVU (ClpYQ) peptidase subunit